MTRHEPIRLALQRAPAARETAQGPARSAHIRRLSSVAALFVLAWPGFPASAQQAPQQVPSPPAMQRHSPAKPAPQQQQQQQQPPQQQQPQQQPQQQQQLSQWQQLPKMQLERQFSGPLQDTIIQRWRDPVDGTTCYIYLPIMAQHSPQMATGFVQYGANTIGSISCTPQPAAHAPGHK